MVAAAAKSQTSSQLMQNNPLPMIITVETFNVLNTNALCRFICIIKVTAAMAAAAAAAPPNSTHSHVSCQIKHTYILGLDLA
jgi:hypothetical protein